MSNELQSEGSDSYTKEFYKELEECVNRSAREIVPVILKMASCSSIVDVGCGTGEWLSVFRDNGVEDVLGIDGYYVDASLLKVPPDKFLPADLRKPLRIDRSFDLAVSLEVAEHLPGECAEALVDSLVRLSPLILFSAAIPFQDGTDHINEQWPGYWVEKFRRRGYINVDCLRTLLWGNSNVAWWYRQNIMLFVREADLDGYPRLQSELCISSFHSLPIVHPELHLYHVSKIKALSDNLEALSEIIERPSVRRMLGLQTQFSRLRQFVARRVLRRA